MLKSPSGCKEIPGFHVRTSCSWAIVWFGGVFVNEPRCRRNLESSLIFHSCEKMWWYSTQYLSRLQMLMLYYSPQPVCIASSYSIECWSSNLLDIIITTAISTPTGTYSPRRHHRLCRSLSAFHRHRIGDSVVTGSATPPWWFSSNSRSPQKNFPWAIPSMSTLKSYTWPIINPVSTVLSGKLKPRPSGRLFARDLLSPQVL